MDEVWTLCLTLLSVIVLSSSQRVAPGVPPQQYQQQYQQPQYQQPQYQPQYQQPQIQAHQIPVQQTLPNQPPVQPQHHEGQPHGNHHVQRQPQQLLNTANIALEKEHIQEHLDVPIDTSKMTEQELQFHYFKMHDADSNNKLDGCELIKSLIHWHENEDDKSEAKVHKDSDLEAIVDPILKELDTNNDGFVDYAEFKRAS